MRYLNLSPCLLTAVAFICAIQNAISLSLNSENVNDQWTTLAASTDQNDLKKLTKLCAKHIINFNEKIKNIKISTDTKLDEPNQTPNDIVNLAKNVKTNLSNTSSEIDFVVKTVHKMASRFRDAYKSLVSFTDVDCKLVNNELENIKNISVDKKKSLVNRTIKSFGNRYNLKKLADKILDTSSNSDILKDNYNQKKKIAENEFSSLWNTLRNHTKNINTDALDTLASFFNGMKSIKFVKKKSKSLGDTALNEIKENNDFTILQNAVELAKALKLKFEDEFELDSGELTYTDEEQKKTTENISSDDEQRDEPANEDFDHNKNNMQPNLHTSKQEETNNSSNLNEIESPFEKTSLIDEMKRKEQLINENQISDNNEKLTVARRKMNKQLLTWEELANLEDTQISGESKKCIDTLQSTLSNFDPTKESAKNSIQTAKNLNDLKETTNNTLKQLNDKMVDTNIKLANSLINSTGDMCANVTPIDTVYETKFKNDQNIKRIKYYLSKIYDPNQYILHILNETDKKSKIDGIKKKSYYKMLQVLYNLKLETKEMDDTALYAMNQIQMGKSAAYDLNQLNNKEKVLKACYIRQILEEKETDEEKQYKNENKTKIMENLNEKDDGEPLKMNLNLDSVDNIEPFVVDNDEETKYINKDKSANENSTEKETSSEYINQTQKLPLDDTTNSGILKKRSNKKRKIQGNGQTVTDEYGEGSQEPIEVESNSTVEELEPADSSKSVNDHTMEDDIPIDSKGKRHRRRNRIPGGDNDGDIEPEATDEQDEVMSEEQETTRGISKENLTDENVPLPHEYRDADNSEFGPSSESPESSKYSKSTEDPMDDNMSASGKLRKRPLKLRKIPGVGQDVTEDNEPESPENIKEPMKGESESVMEELDPADSSKLVNDHTMEDDIPIDSKGKRRRRRNRIPGADQDGDIEQEPIGEQNEDMSEEQVNTRGISKEIIPDENSLVEKTENLSSSESFIVPQNHVTDISTASNDEYHTKEVESFEKLSDEEKSNDDISSELINENLDSVEGAEQYKIENRNIYPKVENYENYSSSIPNEDDNNELSRKGSDGYEDVKNSVGNNNDFSNPLKQKHIDIDSDSTIEKLDPTDSSKTIDSYTLDNIPVDSKTKKHHKKHKIPGTDQENVIDFEPIDEQYEEMLVEPDTTRKLNNETIPDENNRIQHDYAYSNIEDDQEVFDQYDDVTSTQFPHKDYNKDNSPDVGFNPIQNNLQRMKRRSRTTKDEMTENPEINYSQDNLIVRGVEDNRDFYPAILNNKNETKMPKHKKLVRSNKRTDDIDAIENATGDLNYSDKENHDPGNQEKEVENIKNPLGDNRKKRRRKRRVRVLRPYIVNKTTNEKTPLNMYNPANNKDEPRLYDKESMSMQSNSIEDNEKPSSFLFEYNNSDRCKHDAYDKFKKVKSKDAKKIAYRSIVDTSELRSNLLTKLKTAIVDVKSSKTFDEVDQSMQNTSYALKSGLKRIINDVVTEIIPVAQKFIETTENLRILYEKRSPTTHKMLTTLLDNKPSVKDSNKDLLKLISPEFDVDKLVNDIFEKPNTEQSLKEKKSKALKVLFNSYKLMTIATSNIECFILSAMATIGAGSDALNSLKSGRLIMNEFHPKAVMLKDAMDLIKSGESILASTELLTRQTTSNSTEESYENDDVKYPKVANRNKNVLKNVPYPNQTPNKNRKKRKMLSVIILHPNKQIEYKDVSDASQIKNLITHQNKKHKNHPNYKQPKFLKVNDKKAVNSIIENITKKAKESGMTREDMVNEIIENLSKN